MAVTKQPIAEDVIWDWRDSSTWKSQTGAQSKLPGTIGLQGSSVLLANPLWQKWVS